MSIENQISEIQRIARNVPEAIRLLGQLNDAPTERQLDILHAWTQSLDAALARLPNATTQNLLRRSAIIAKHRRLYRSVSAAVRRLPVEILQAIFIELICHRDTDCQQRGYDVFNVNAGPWPLSHVSRLWRAAALGCPELWATMSVNRGISWNWRRSPHLIRGPITLLTAALAHSGQHDLCFDFMDGGRDASRLLRVLLEHCHRWCEVQLYLWSSDVELLHDIGSRVPRLKSCTYQTFGDGGVLREQPIVALHKAPSLVELCMIGPPLDVESVALTKVVKLSYRAAAATGRDRVYDPLDALALCPNAKDVSLDTGALPYGDEWSPLLMGLTDYIVRKKVTRFATSDVGILDCLCLPSLSYLCIFLTKAFVYSSELPSSRPNFVCPAHLPNLLAFLRRSRCPLTHLVLGGTDLCSPTASLADIFALIPGLERLEISYGIPNVMFSEGESVAIQDCVSELVETLSTTGLLPKLEVVWN